MSALLAMPGWRRRAWVGLALGAGILAVFTLWLAPDETTGTGPVTLASAVLLYLVPVVIVAVFSGLWLGLAAAIAADAALNWFFVPPYHTFFIDRRDNFVALTVYILVGVTVAVAVDVAARQRAAAVRSGVETRLLARITAQPLADRSLPLLLDHIREAFGMRAVALVDTSAGPDTVIATAGEPPPAGTPSLTVSGGDGLRLDAYGPGVSEVDREPLGWLVAAAARTLEAQRQAAHAAQLAEVDRLRTAILAAVGHDLRTPLAGIKAAASSLRDPDVAFSPADADELLATIEESADRLDDLVENLLAMSRLQAGVLSAQIRPVALDEVVSRAVLQVPPGVPVRVEVGDDLPRVHADAGLLERVIANLVSNAVLATLRAGSTAPVLVDAAVEISGATGAEAGGTGANGTGANGEGAHGEGRTRVRLRVIDHGPGVPPPDRERMFAPFQRLDDRSTGGGMGLGLAIARGFTEAMAGTLVPSGTPGGGLTMTVTLPADAVAEADRT